MSGSKNCNEDALRRRENTEPEISILSRAENKSSEPESQISRDKTDLKHSELESIKINDCFSEPEPSISLRVFDPNITKLDLSSQNLLELDSSISNLIQLQDLNLASNNLKTFPSEILNLKLLRVLNLAQNNITEARLDFSDLIHLEFLDIKENLLQYIPGNLEDLQSLKYLDLSYNKLRRLPEYFQSNLETLILDGNELKDQTKLPTWIIKQNALQILSLAAVWFKELIDVFIGDISLNNLVKLDLRCSNIDLIPQSLTYLENLEVLELGNCRDIMDNALTHWNRTKCSFEMRNEIHNLPKFVKLSNLTTLSAENLNLQSVPESIHILVNLENLNLSGNFIEELPPGILELGNLKFLNLNLNKLWSIPSSLFMKLSQLRHALLARNNLYEIPELNGDIELETLDIYGNLLEEVPEMVFKLESLVRLDLGGMIHINSKAIEDIGEGYLEKYEQLRENYKTWDHSDKSFERTEKSVMAESEESVKRYYFNELEEEEEEEYVECIEEHLINQRPGEDHDSSDAWEPDSWAIEAQKEKRRAAGQASTRITRFPPLRTKLLSGFQPQDISEVNSGGWKEKKDGLEDGIDETNSRFCPADFHAKSITDDGIVARVTWEQVKLVVKRQFED